MWYGAIMGFSGVLAKAKFFDWLAGVFGNTVSFDGIDPVIILFALLVMSVLVRD